MNRQFRAVRGPFRAAAAALVAGGLVAGGLSLAATAAVAGPSAYAPVDHTGPRLSVPATDLRASLACSGKLRHAAQEPVLVVPGTTQDPVEQHRWNYLPAFEREGRPYCTVTLPKFALEDMQISAEYVVHGIRTMYRTSGRRIAVLGGSQGGSLPRWALRFWPDTRAMVADHIALAPSNHGTPAAAALGAPGNWAPSIWQQMVNSAFMTALNSGQETFPGIDYTVVTSMTDGEVPFFLSPLDNGGGGRVANVVAQGLCPGHVADHVKMVTYDPVGYALAMDALTHDGPADPTRFDRAVCGQEFPPGVDPQAAVTGFATVYATAAQRLVEGERASREPALRCYVTGTCGQD